MLRPLLIIPIILSSFLIQLNGQIKEDETDSSKSQNTDILIGPHHTGPEYPGGMKAWQNHLRKTIKPIQSPCESGKVFVSFKVLASGELDSVQVYRGLCEIADQNAIEIVKTSGRWTPEYRKGKPIDSRIGIQIVYRYGKK